MKQIKYLLVLLLLCFACGQGERISTPFPLPRNGSEVSITAAVRPPRIQKLVHRFNSAIAEQQVWIQGYLAEVEPKLKPGMTLPYHERFRLTESEYREMVKGMKETSYEPVDEELVSVEKKGDKIGLHFGPKLSLLNDIVFDGGDFSVKTPIGAAPPPRRVEQKEGRLGTWSGYTWGSTESNLGELKLSIGTISRSGRGFLYYLAHKHEKGELQTATEYLLMFDIEK